MRFHEVHGLNVVLNSSRFGAKRSSSFCDAFVFSEVPLRHNTSVAIKLKSEDSEWLGFGFIGLTSKNPMTFIESVYSKHIINLIDSEDVWIKQISNNWSNASLILHLNYDGQLEIISEHEPNIKYIFLENLPVNFPLWLIIDLYGSTNLIEFPRYSSPNFKEIIPFGSDIYAAYKSGEDGIVPYNSAHINLIGPKKSGKSQLKNFFINNLYPDSKNDDAEETSNYFLVANNESDWTLNSNSGQITKATLFDRTKSEFYQDLAQNIVHEILIINKESFSLENNSESLSSKEMIKNVLKFPRKIRRTYSKEVKQLSENLNEIPEEMMAMIEDLLKNATNDNAKKNSESSGTLLSNSNAINPAPPQQKYIFNVTDFSGSLIYLLVNQFFFTSCAVYILVFNLAEDLNSALNSHEDLSSLNELGIKPLTLLDTIHLWVSLIHSTVASFSMSNEIEGNNKNEEREESKSVHEDLFRLQPQIVLVGTHRNSVHAEPITRNQIINESFGKIFKSFENKSYGGHLHFEYIALDSKEMSFDEPELVQNFRLLIKNLIINQKLTGFNIPLCWVQLEQVLEKFKQRGINFVEINQLHEVVSSQIEAFQSYENFISALNFHHNQGKIFCLDFINGLSNVSNTERNNFYELGIIIINPKWFIDCIYLLCNYLSELKNDDDNFFSGIVSENLINTAWSEFIDQKFILLGCLENLDMICELSPYIQLEDVPDLAPTTDVLKMYFFPWINRSSTAEYGHGNQNNNDSSISESTFQFFIVFDILPLSLFTRLLIRISKWSWNQGWGRKPEMCNAKGRIAVDFDHDIIMKIDLFQGRIYLMIVKIFEEIQNDQIENLFFGPAANVCVKVQHLIESELELLKETYYRRLNFKLAIACPCDVVCARHKVESCPNDKCLHFLSLRECLQKKVVECQYNRQIRTTFIQRFLPYTGDINNDLLNDTVYNSNSNEEWDNVFQMEPQWMREAAKLLNSSSKRSNQDWMILAKRLSYSERDLIRFAEEPSPSLAFLKDWYESNGRTRCSVDVLISCLRMLSRDDVALLIEYEIEPESASPPIFLSYQHDSQKQVIGFPCWMDTSGMTGGDSLYSKIYDGISRAKVFICCLTPRYVASAMCNREVTLADVLHKPILPLIIELTPWPPPGGLALIMSSIVYVDLCGVGSHSGIGRLQDSESRFREILNHVSRYISGYSDVPTMPSRYLHLPDFFHSRHRNNLGEGNTSFGGRRTNRRLQSMGLSSRQHSIRSSNRSNLSSALNSNEMSSIHFYQQQNRIFFGDNSNNFNDEIHHNTIGNNRNSIFHSNNSSDEVNDDHERYRDGRLLTEQQPRSNSLTNENEIPFTDGVIPNDNISVMSRSRMANRITNCSVCRIM